MEEEMTDDPLTAEFCDALNALYQSTTAINAAGGIRQLATAWPPDIRTSCAASLRALAKLSTRWADKLEALNTGASEAGPVPD